MDINVQIPNQVLSSPGPDVARQILETVALEGFKSGQLSIYQVRKILGFESRFEAHDFLTRHDVPWSNYSIEDLESDRKTLDELLSR